jgi:hypothetical protein
LSNKRVWLLLIARPHYSNHGCEDIGLSSTATEEPTMSKIKLVARSSD